MTVEITSEGLLNNEGKLATAYDGDDAVTGWLMREVSGGQLQFYIRNPTGKDRSIGHGTRLDISGIEYVTNLREYVM